MPTAYGIPAKFNVSLLEDSPNPNAICLGAKAVAESAMSVDLGPYLAVKQAICVARDEFQWRSDFFQLDVPLIPEAIRTAFGVTETSMTRETAVVTYNRANKWTRKVCNRSLELEHELEQLFDGCSCHAYVDGTVHVITGCLEYDDTIRPTVVVSQSRLTIVSIFRWRFCELLVRIVCFERLLPS